MSEQLAFKQFPRDRWTVDFDTRFVGSGAIIVDDSTHVLFPSTGFTLEQYGDAVVIGELSDLGHEVLGGGAFGDNSVERVSVGVLPALHMNLALQRQQLRRSAQRVQEVFHVNGFGHEVEGSQFRRLDGIFDCASRGDQNNKQVGGGLFDTGQHVQAREIRHDQIKHENIRFSSTEQPKRFLSGTRGLDHIAVIAEA